jgi:endonuclease/exonuclease/phosphatase family metal-dependent hydrolase
MLTKQRVVDYLCGMKKHSRNRILTLPLLFVVVILFMAPRSWSQGTDVHVMFYNVENLFDTVNDPKVNDSEFLPDGRYGWNSERYFHKLDQLGRVISGDGRGDFPAIVGLCEIENLLVLEALASSTHLRDAGYEIVHYDSPDGRGIDVALFYRPSVFTLLTSSPIPVRLPSDLDFRTRDILFVQGILGADTLNLYVNHWSSRVGGVEVTEPRRVQAAHVLRRHLDSVANHFLVFNALIMGDFNDEPHDRSVHEVLNALIPGQDSPAGNSKTTLWNLAGTIPEGEGTFWFWRDRAWNILDHIIVTESLMNHDNRRTKTGLTLKPGSFRVMKEPWMLKEDNEYQVPFRSYTRQYDGGFSDHLPVLVTLVVNDKPRKYRRRCMLRKN